MRGQMIRPSSRENCRERELPCCLRGVDKICMFWRGKIRYMSAKNSTRVRFCLPAFVFRKQALSQMRGPALKKIAP